MDAKEWVTVATETNAVTARIIKNALDADGIRCNLEGEMQAAEPGLSALPVKIQVQAKDAELAREILEQYEREQEASRAAGPMAEAAEE